MSDKSKALSAALSQIERQFGKGSVMRMGDQKRERIPAISTGSLGLDIALGIGGLPKGRIVEIYGPESSGKTTLTLSVIAQAQKKGATCAFVDAEHALDPDYAEKLGVNVDDLIVSQPDTGEQALEITDMLVRSGAVDVVIVDSVAALVPKAEIEGEMGDAHVGLQARLMSQALRKITGNVKNANCMVCFINQIRMKIGVMFGNPETTTGGNALKFYSSVRLDIRRIGAVKQGDEVIGNETRVKVVKNKVSPPFKQAEFQILYGQGINQLGEVLDLGVQQGWWTNPAPGTPTRATRSARASRTPVITWPSIRTWPRPSRRKSAPVCWRSPATSPPRPTRSPKPRMSERRDGAGDGPVDEATLRQYAIKLLARRDHARAELALKMRRKFGDEAPLEAVLGWCEEHDFLDDRRFAGFSCVRASNAARAVAHSRRAAREGRGRAPGGGSPGRDRL